jgi:outer membrane protein assembly factor BamB
VSPVIAADRVVVAQQSGILAAYGLQDGIEQWSVKISVTGPLAVADRKDDLIVVPSNESLHAYSAVTGAVVWIADCGPLSAPVLLRGGWLIAASAEHVMAFRASDGKQVWNRRIGGVTERPAIDGPTLYMSTVDGRVVAVEVATGSLVWERRVGTELTEPLAIGERVYLGANRRHFVCLKARNGDVDWRATIGAAVRGAPAVDAAHVYLVAMDNLLRALDRHNGALRWKRDLTHRPSSGPVVLGGTVTVPGMTPLLNGYDARTGAPAAQWKLKDPLAVTPAFHAVAGGAGMIAAITGSLQNRWTLMLATEAPPAIPIAPLTVLPGSVKAPGF